MYTYILSVLNQADKPTVTNHQSRIAWNLTSATVCDEAAMIMGHEMAHALREHARERMATASGGKGIAFLSTHPSGPDRIRQLEANVPKVMGLYEAARKG